MESAAAKSPLDRAASRSEDQLGHLYFDWFILRRQGEPKTLLAAFPDGGRQRRRPRRVGAGVADGPEDHRESTRSIEIVVHAPLEARNDRLVRWDFRERPGFPGEVVEPLDGSLCLVQEMHVDAHRGAVVRLEHQGSQHPAVIALEQLFERGDVPHGLAHLLARLIHDHAVVRPAPGEHLAVGDRLGTLVLVVREDQVQTAEVEVETFAQQVERHDHAFGVPARPAFAPRGRPCGLARFGVLPENEIERGTLGRLRAGLHPGAGLQHVQVLPGEQAVTGERLGREIDPVAPFVGVTLGKQVADKADHVVHVSGGVRDGVGALHAEGVHYPPPQGLVARSNLIGRTLLFDGAGDDLVLDVGHVRHEVNL